MTGDASYQQLGVDATMMSGCFGGGGGGGGAPVFHDGSLSGFGEPADAAASFSVDGGSMLAGQLQLIRATAPQSVLPGETARGAYGGGYGPSPSDVTVAHVPKVAKQLAGEMEGSWIQEPYCCPTWFFSGDGVRGPFTVAASELSLSLLRRAESSSHAGAVNVISLPDQSPEVSCSGLTHASSSAGTGGGVFQPLCGGGGEMAPLHFSQVLPRLSAYAHLTQQTLDEFVGCLLQDVAGFAGGDASCPLPMSSSSKTMSSDPPVFLGSEEHAHQKLRNHLQKLLQLVSPKLQARVFTLLMMTAFNLFASRTNCNVRNFPAKRC
jgi:hypothetical protein